MISATRDAVRKPHTCPAGEAFLALLPQIRTQARCAFRAVPAERREELVAEVVAHCYVAFVRLLERGLEDVIYPTPLARFAIKRVRSGRPVAGRQNVNDVSSRYSQQRRGFAMERLDRFDEESQQWKELLIEDKHAGPAQTAASRIDFESWLGSLPPRSRRLAALLATGETTKQAARTFRVSPGRISQLRRTLAAHWQQFQGAPAPA